jgi:hypothetical protein
LALPNVVRSFLAAALEYHLELLDWLGSRLLLAYQSASCSCGKYRLNLVCIEGKKCSSMYSLELTGVTDRYLCCSGTISVETAVPSSSGAYIQLYSTSGTSSRMSSIMWCIDYYRKELVDRSTIIH